MSLSERHLLRVISDFTLCDLHTCSSWVSQGSSVNDQGAWQAGIGKGCISGCLSRRKNYMLVHILG